MDGNHLQMVSLYVKRIVSDRMYDERMNHDY